MTSGVVSLFDLMQRYRLDYLSIFLQSSVMFQRQCKALESSGLMVLDDHAMMFCKMVEGLRISMQQADADSALLAQLEAFSRALSVGGERRPSVLEAQTKQLITGIDAVLQNRLFMFVPIPQARYYMNLEQFGNAVSMFPLALSDMLETSNCYAAGCSTACVFHAMRVAEHGLRHIAKQLKVKIADKGKPSPVEYATWEKVLTQIANKRHEVRQTPKSKKHENKTIEYAAFADHLANLKDLWRNPTMHSRGQYSTQEALGVMTRVAEFMNLIAGSVYAPPVGQQTLDNMRALVSVTKEIGSGI